MIKIEKDFDEIEKLLYTKHSQIKKNGISHIKKLLSKFNNPHKKMGHIIHITGTNGKGTVAYITSSILRNMGFNTALYISPHINSLTERIQINGKPITKEDFVYLFKKIEAYSHDLSFFEIMTLIAFLYFHDRVDYSVIEVGIGGLYDTTNVFDETTLCFITSIGMDHTDMLGHKLKDIALQKAGIIKKNSVCVTGKHSSEIRRVIEEKCIGLNSRLIEVDDFFEIKKYNLDDNTMVVVNKNSGREFKMGILGIKQTFNLSLVLKGLNEIGVIADDDLLKKALININIDCRFQTIIKYIKDRKKTFILDGAHNPEAISVFMDNLKFFNINNPVLIFSILSTKDYSEVIKIINNRNVFKRIIVCEIKNFKKLNPYLIADEFLKHKFDIDVSIIPDIDIALKKSTDISDNICVAGSFYLASDALRSVYDINWI